MKRRIAKVLRRLANRFDPPVKVSSDNPLDRPPATPASNPLEWIASSELAQELIKRNDIGLVIYGRHKPAPAGQFNADMEIYWRMRECEVEPTVHSICNALGFKLKKKGK